MSDSFDETKRELYGLFQRLRNVRLITSPNGLTQAEAHTLFAISELRENHENIRPGLVAEVMHTTPSALSQTLKALEEKGLIERSRTSGDYRAVSVNLTEEGELCAEAAKCLRNEHMERVLSCVGEDDMRHLVRILQKVLTYHDGADNESLDDSLTQREGDAPCA